MEQSPCSDANSFSAVIINFVDLFRRLMYSD